MSHFCIKLLQLFSFISICVPALNNVLRKIDASEHRAPFSCFILQESLKCEPAFCSAFFFLLLEKKIWMRTTGYG